MGYYINAQGTITMPRSLEAEALHALKMLNYDHETKRGGLLGNPDATFETRWYSWMPERWHEHVASVKEVLEMVGFGVTTEREDGLDVYIVTYDSKTGQEDVFLNCLAGYAHVEVEVVGEDGSRWMWANSKAGAPLHHLSAEVTYTYFDTVENLIAKERKMWSAVRERTSA
jgi:hypothetical protein